MKDGLMLLLTGAASAAGAALFFKIFGSDALNIIVLLALVVRWAITSGCGVDCGRWASSRRSKGHCEKKATANGGLMVSA